jgi:mono/diheme cytochrome c family protein
MNPGFRKHCGAPGAQAGPKPVVETNRNVPMKKILALSIAALAVVALSVRAEDAKSLYENNCAKCHGSDGKGQTKMGQKVGCKDYTDAKVQDALKDDVAAKSIKEGLKDGDKTLMRPFEALTDSDIKGLVGYMRTFKK